MARLFKFVFTMLTWTNKKTCTNISLSVHFYNFEFDQRNARSSNSTRPVSPALSRCLRLQRQKAWSKRRNGWLLGAKTSRVSLRCILARERRSPQVCWQRNRRIFNQQPWRWFHHQSGLVTEQTHSVLGSTAQEMDLTWKFRFEVSWILVNVLLHWFVSVTMICDGFHWPCSNVWSHCNHWTWVGMSWSISTRVTVGHFKPL